MCRNKNALSRRSKLAAGKRIAKKGKLYKTLVCRLKPEIAAFCWPFERRKIGMESMDTADLTHMYTQTYTFACMNVCVCKWLGRRQHAESSVSHPWLNSWPRQRKATGVQHFIRRLVELLLCYCVHVCVCVIGNSFLVPSPSFASAVHLLYLLLPRLFFFLHRFHLKIVMAWRLWLWLRLWHTNPNPNLDSTEPGKRTKSAWQATLHQRQMSSP